MEMKQMNLGNLFMLKRLSLSNPPCRIHVPQLIPDWIINVVEDVRPTNFELFKLEFLSLNEISCWRKKGLGLSDVPFLLGKEGKCLEVIPVELQGKTCILLIGTVVQVYGNSLRIPCLVYNFVGNGSAWRLGFKDINLNNWKDEYDRLILPCSKRNYKNFASKFLELIRDFLNF